MIMAFSKKKFFATGGLCAGGHLASMQEEATATSTQTVRWTLPPPKAPRPIGSGFHSVRVRRRMSHAHWP